MFDVNGEYANRKGTYTVLEISGTKMKVRFEDGTISELNIAIQERIWQNILTEREAARRKSIRRSASAANRSNFYVRSLSLNELEDTTPPALQERLSYVTGEAPELKSGDRFIYYAIEPNVFFAVATSTGSPIKAGKKIPKYMLAHDATSMLPLDWDAHILNLEAAVPLDSVELESQPDYRSLIHVPDTYLPISEDDFELLAELVTEQSEDEDSEDDLEEDEDELEDE